MKNAIQNSRLLILTIILLICLSSFTPILSFSKPCIEETTDEINNVSNMNLIKNLNPDPSGEPWIPEGYWIPENRTYMSDKKVNELLEKSKHPQNYELPSKVDHTYSKHMRAIFNQV